MDRKFSSFVFRMPNILYESVIQLGVLQSANLEAHHTLWTMT